MCLNHSLRVEPDWKQNDMLIIWLFSKSDFVRIDHCVAWLAGLVFLITDPANPLRNKRKWGGCCLTCLFPFLAFPLGNPRFPLVQFSLQYFLGTAV